MVQVNEGRVIHGPVIIAPYKGAAQLHGPYLVKNVIDKQTNKKVIIRNNEKKDN